MKRFVLLLLLVGFQAQAQYTFKTVVDTPKPPKINILISNLGINSNIDQLQTLIAYNQNQNGFAFYANGKQLFLNSEVTVKTRFLNQAIQIEMSGLTKNDLVVLQNTKDNVYLSPQKDIVLTLADGTKPTIAKTDLEQQSLGRITIEENVMEMYFAAFGGEYAYANNSFNWGMTPKSDSDLNKMELNAEFSFHQTYGFGNGKSQKPLVFYSKGRVSTNSKDSLNYLYIYPVNFDISGAGDAQMIARLGIESNQAFTSGRMAFNFSWEKLIGNLVDFTYGSNRLRLKPVLNIGGKVYKEFDNMRIGADSENQFSGQIYANLYYNIPIMDNYTLILESNAYYDFSETINPDQKVKLNYSIALGVDLPKTPFKTLFKYKDGHVDVNNLDDSNLTIGLLADLESLIGVSAKK